MGQKKGFKHSDESKKRISDKLKIYMNTPEMKQFMSNVAKSRNSKRIYTIEDRQRIREVQLKLNANSNYPLIYSVKRIFRYRLWKKEILARDNNTCQECFRKYKINVHHKIPLISIIKKYENELKTGNFDVPVLYDINNGITLCENCHALAHNKISKVKKRELYQIIDSLKIELLEKQKIIDSLKEA